MKETSTRHRDAIDKVADALDEVFVCLIADDTDLDRILACCAEMRGYIVQAKGQAHAADVIETHTIHIPNDQPRVYADEARADEAMTDAEWEPFAKALNIDDKPKKLPKLKPQGHEAVKYKPGIQKLMRNARSFDCPACHAEAGAACFKFEGPGAHPKRTNERHVGKFHHRSRQDLAAAYNKRVKAQNIIN